MSNITLRAREILSREKVTVAILLLAIIGRIIQVVYFFNIRVDRSFQVMATDNLLHGHGITTAQVFAPDLSRVVYEPLIKWPPGYSLLLAPLYAAFNHNYIVAGMILDIIFAIIFIFVTRNILRSLGLAGHWVNIFTLVAGFFVYDFYLICTADAIAITFFLTAFYFALLLVQNPSKKWLTTACVILFLLLCVITKYSLLTAVFVIPLFIIAYGIFGNNQRLKKVGLYILGALMVGLGGLLVFQKYNSGSAAFVSEAPRGFFPQNLLVAFPLFPSAFIRPETLLHVLRGIDREKIFHFFQEIYLVFLLLILIYFFRSFFKKRFKELTPVDIFLYFCFFISSAVILLLVVLSLRIAKNDQSWTFIQEPRYYGLPLVLMQLTVFALLLCQWGKNSRIFKKFLYVFIFLLVPEVFYGVFIDLNRIMKFNKEEYSWQYEDRFQKYAAGLIDRELQRYPGGNVVVSGRYYMCHRISLHNHVPILYEVDKINRLSALNTRKPVVLLVFLHQKELLQFQDFLAAPGKNALGHFNEYYFYSVYVNPH